MKHMKKLASVLLALVMAAALTAPALAATSTLKVPDGTGHTYTLFPVFTGEVAVGGGSLKQDTIDWAEGIGGSAIVAALKDMTFTSKEGTKSGSLFDEVEEPYDGTAAAQKLAEILWKNFSEGKPYDTQANRTDLAEAIYKNGVSESTPRIPAKTGEVIATGYWVAIEEVGENDPDPAYHLYMVTEGTTEINTKKGDSKVEKEVQDKQTNVWANGAVYTEDDEIPFRLVITLPDDMETSYSTTNPYNIVLHDVQSDGFLVDSVSITSVALFAKGADITAGGTALTEGTGTNGTTWALSKEGCTNADGDKVAGCAFEISIGNLQDNGAAKSGGKLVVNYTAKFDPEKVKTGIAGNENEVNLYVNNEFVNNSTVKVFEIEFMLDKKDGDGNPLAGAEFELYKVVADGEDQKLDLVQNAEDVYETDAEGNPKTDAEGNPVVRWPAGTHFSFKGLEDGTYILKEVVMPDGKTAASGESKYNPIDDIEFTVKAGVVTVKGTPSLNVSITEKSVESIEANAQGNITAAVENVTGILMPETGGIGTTIFYIAGGILAVGAVVLLITKRRVSADED